MTKPAARKRTTTTSAGDAPKVMEQRRDATAGQETSNPFAEMGGSAADEFNATILRETLATIWVPGTEQDRQMQRVRAGMAALRAFKPRDEIEGMLAAQTVALHFGAMECLRRAMLKDQPGEFQSKLCKDGANLARAMTEMLDALDRKRGKGPQVVRVERVVVQEGGQAIVGNVSSGGAATSPRPAIEAAAPAPALDLSPAPARALASAGGRGEG